MQTARPRVPVWLIVIYVLALATLLAWPFVAFMSIFAFDAPGSTNNPAVWSGVILVLSYPLLPLIGVPGSFFAYRKGWRVPSYILAGLGAVPLAIILLGLIAMLVSDFAFLVGSRF